MTKEVFLKKYFKIKLKKPIILSLTACPALKKMFYGDCIFKKKNSQAKLLTVVYGKIFDVCVDLRKKSKTYGKYFSIELSQKSALSILIPAGFAHGFLCLSKECAIYYKSSNYRNQNSEITLAWNDPALKINWPNKNPILSTKDQNGILFGDLK